ncbi:response regulator transcription factor [Paraburkholderia sp. BR14263]|uniref:response regulator transcription factor n=1 Tax=unclassified Paraburkholderia TaxID=2615204 RepID=UPI0020B772B1|nr:winged helix-turn-helix domain-containing protein [Paraburkholderia sp. CNPSo 3272]MCP3725147.1 winged helix-turn-helix domain-containing protein [Paraburkholderia sp. CNPSo 3272]
MRVLFAAPSHPESTWLFKALQESAYSLQRADDLRDSIFLARHEAYDAIVTMTFDPARYAALLGSLGELSAVGRGAAIIVLLGLAAAQDRARVLRAGADACFCQPYSFIELHERMQALRRTALSRAANVQPAAAPLLLDPLTRELVDGERRLAVTRREYLLLECLMRQFNAPVPRDQLTRYAWPETGDVDPSNVNLVVSRLRRKLTQHLPDVHVQTVNRYGYQLSTARR